MRRILSIGGILAALLFGLWMFRTMFPGDEKLIRKMLAEAADTAGVKPNENPISRLAGAAKLAGFFSADTVLKLDVTGVDARSINGRDELQQAIAAARTGLQEATIRLHQVQVVVASDRESAAAQLVASAFLDGNRDPLVQELKVQLRKIDRHWKITQVETLKSLEVKE